MVSKEISWVIICGSQDMAVGVVYYSVVRDQKGITWNEKLHEKIESDTTELKQQGKRVVLLGDFNGHIGEVNEQGQVQQADHQGKKTKGSMG